MSNRYCRLSMAALVAFGTASGSAAAVEIKSLAIAPSNDAFDQKPVIHVRASSGKWTRASTEKVWFNVRLSGKASGASFDYVVFGVPKVRSDAGPNSSHPNNWVIRVNDDSFSNSLRLSAKGTQLGIMTREAVAACSRLYSSGKRPDRDHTLPLMFPAELHGTVFDKRHIRNIGKTALATLPGHVVCEKDPHWGGVRTDSSHQPKRTDSSHQPKRTDPFHVETASLSIRNLNDGACSPRLVELIAQFETNKQGTVKFRLRRDDGTVETISSEARQWGTKWVARYSKIYQIKKTTDRKYKVNVVGHPKATGWKAMTVRCGSGHNAAGGFKVKRK